MPVNEAEKYGVCVEPCAPEQGATYWKITNVRHLPPGENRGKHNVYVNALSEDGTRHRDAGLRIGWGWEGQRGNEEAPPRALDKPANEPMGNLEMYANQHITLWLQGDGLPSDKVGNLHTGHATEITGDGEAGNYWGHHSFQVTFQRTETDAQPPKPRPDDPPPPAMRLKVPVDATPTQRAVVITWNRYGNVLAPDVLALLAASPPEPAG